MPPRAQLAVCTCKAFGCSSSTFQGKHGDVQPGKVIPSSTRSHHRKRDQDVFQQQNDQTDHAEDISLPLPNEELEDDGQPTVNGELGDENNNLLGSVYDGRRSLYIMSCTLASWLHLGCGLSREATTRVMTVLYILLTIAMNLGIMIARADQQPLFSIPRDVRKAMSALSLNPTIIRSICCPKCFKKYDLDSLPEICLRRETARSKPCGRSLWTTRFTRSGPKHVPERLYSIQDLASWLEYFLSRPGIEDLIDKSYSHIPSPETMHSLWDSPAWRSLGSFTTTQHNLTFSFYIDWFNPYTNKTAGKTASCGAIMMFCLNLPYELQHLPENTFFAGMTPPPKEPSVTTITALTDPIVDQLEAFWAGKIVRTRRHPLGIQKRIAVLPAIGDLLAMRKALGFASVTSHNFCSFCILKHADMGDLNYKAWMPRIGVDVRSQAQEWQSASTKVRRKEIFDAHGVRWSSLHRLSYRDPVRHTMLGVMHNWIEGVLQHHARVKWGVGVALSGKAAEQADAPKTAHLSPLVLDVAVLDHELENLVKESRKFKDSPSHHRRIRTEASILLDGGNDGSDGDIDMDFEPDDLDSDEESGDDDVDLALGSASAFKPTALEEIRACISGVAIPTWLERPPSNLGMKSHGKLKADQWFTLFTIFLPLILPELWGPEGQDESQPLLENFIDLVTCTNILCAHAATNAASDEYMAHYVRYRQTSLKLFPHANTRPNHHFAMHNGDLMKFWGPLIKLSEFGYERHNGSLQKIHTNSHIWELDFTMLQQMCRRGRFLGFIKGEHNDPLEASMASAISPHNDEEDETAQTSRKQKMVPIATYASMLKRINATNPRYRHFKDFPHPSNALILPQLAASISYTSHKSRTYATYTRHPGNSSISYGEAGDVVAAGFIQEIWNHSLSGKEHIFLLVSQHQQLSTTDALKSPYNGHPGLLGQIVYSGLPDTSQWTVINRDQVIGHVAYYLRPPGTFGIASPTLVLVDSLHRYRL